MMWLIMISLNLMSCQLIQITYAFPNQWPYPYGMLKCWGLLSCISLELNCDIYHLPCFLFAYPLWLRLYICSPGAVLSIRLQQTSSQSTGMLSDVYISQPTSRLFTTLSTMPFNLLFSGFLHHVPYIYAADPYIPLLSTVLSVFGICVSIPLSFFQLDYRQSSNISRRMFLLLTLPLR